jgi:hypothetical protein
MPAWNEAHYTRAREFIRLLRSAVAAPAADVAPPLPSVAALARSSLLLPAAPAPPAPAPIPATTAAGLFKKMPWKK